MATIRYLAVISECPEELVQFYDRYLGIRELGRSSTGDIAITDGFLNLTLFRKRPALCEPRMETGLNHIGIQVESVEQAKNLYLKLYPRGPVIPEEGDLYHGIMRIHGEDVGTGLHFAGKQVPTS
jgi:catechol-2,3-dioxygenase